MDPLLETEEIERAQRAERVQKVVGGIVITLALGALLCIPFLPSSPVPTAYEQCGRAGISREMVDKARTVMAESNATYEEKLNALIGTLTTSRNVSRVRACALAILSDAKDLKDSEEK